MRAEIQTPGDRQLGLLWGGVSLALLALSPLAPRLATAMPPCVFKLLTGLPCPGCGTTRAALALARFEPFEAFYHWPLPTLGWLVLLGGGLLAGLRVLRGRPLPALPGRLPLALRLGAVGVILLGWGWAIATGV